MGQPVTATVTMLVTFELDGYSHNDSWREVERLSTNRARRLLRERMSDLATGSDAKLIKLEPEADE